MSASSAAKVRMGFLRANRGVGGNCASDRHPAHERAEDDADGGRRGSERQEEQTGPRELENEGRETAYEESQKKQDAS